jgi:hypothetical protein
MRHRASAGETKKIMRCIDSASSERGRVAVGGMRRSGTVRWAAAARGGPRIGPDVRISKEMT